MQSGQRTRSTAQAVPLEVVRDDETPTEIKAGRKRKLTPAIFEKIMAVIEAGGRVTPACRQHGISPVTLFMRVGRNLEEAKRFAEAKQIRLQKWHEEWLGEMHEHAKRSPWATAWLLERNFPELYALREFVRPVANGSQLVGDKVPEERLREYGRLMLEFAQQNQAKAQGEPPSLPAPASNPLSSKCLSTSYLYLTTCLVPNQSNNIYERKMSSVSPRES